MEKNSLSSSAIIKRLGVLLMVCIISISQIVAQDDAQREVRGVVTDNIGTLLPGVNVIVKGTLIGAITDLNGEYSINIGEEGEKLVFSSVGMKTVEIVISDQTIIDVVIEEDIIGLEEVVVTGYMTQRKADLTGSITVIDKKDLESVSSSNVMKSLQGKIPGVYITVDGNPGEDVNIEIRGRTSSTSSPPLLVIDGLPTNANLREINPMDIESMQVLKDAASASIYGSRAASGVILITTKQGKPGDFSVSYEGSVGVNTYLRKPDLMNTEEYGRATWQAAVNDGLDPNLQTMLYDYDWNEVNGVPTLNNINTTEWLNAAHTMRAADSDWFDLITQNGRRQNHQLSVSSATDKARQLFSLNYYENNGAQIHTYLKRISARINTSYDLLDGKLKIGENLGVSATNYNTQNNIYRALVMPSIAPEYAIDGETWGGSALESGMDEHRHPTRIATLDKVNDSKRVKAIGSMFADLTLFKGFSLRSQIGIEYSARNYRHIDFSWEEEGGQGDELNGVSSYNSKSFIWTWTNTAQYSYSNDIHSLDVLAGMESFRAYSEEFSGSREQIELENYDYAHLSAATGNVTATGYGSEITLLSYFGKINYSLQNKYLIAITARYDGSSKFPTNNKFGFFPSASFGWRLSNEEFMQSIDVISDLKLRVSWGMNGNSNISSNAITDSYDADYQRTAYMIDGSPQGLMPSGYRLTHRGNQDLFWEATEQTNVGLDFGLFNHKLSGTFDVYHKITDGMLYEPDYIGTIGEGGDTWINAANMTNNGVELGITYRNQSNAGFHYSITGNLAANSNKIDDLPAAVVYSYGGNGLGDDILGRPYRSIYGFVYDGIYQNQQEVDEGPEQNGKGVGRMKFKDLDGDGRITEEYDRTWIGIREPDLTYGLNTYFEFKGFDLNLFLQGVLGNDVYNDYKLLSDFYNTGVIAGRNHTTRVLDAWTPYNTSSMIPALSILNRNEETASSTYFVESGSYLKLRNIEVGYTLPVHVSKKFNVQYLRVYISAENTLQFTKRSGDNAFTGVDPEIVEDFENAYDRPSIFTIGLKATF
ncbi:MAG: TonB-dependent receptor [Bacteroidales bacterium]|nr:TonB-dependent receptor [Bacteroidales bacterium]